MEGIWKYNEYSKTASVFLYFMNIRFNQLGNYGFKLKDAYLADHGNPIDYGCECIFVRLTVSNQYIVDYEGVLKVFERRPDTVINSYRIGDDLIVVLRIHSSLLKDLNHFRKGEYSRIRKELANEYFAYNDIRYKVLVKSALLKKELEKLLEMTLDDDAELADAPDPRREILRFNPSMFEHQKHLWKRDVLPPTLLLEDSLNKQETDEL